MGKGGGREEPKRARERQEGNKSKRERRGHGGPYLTVAR